MNPEVSDSPLLNLLCPVSCAGCGKWDTGLCRRCLESGGPAFRCESQLSAWQIDAPVWALGVYEAYFRNLILSLKHDPRVDLQLWTDRLARIVAEEIWPTYTAKPPPALVPVPCSWGRRLRRAEIVSPWARQIQTHLHPITQVEECLRIRLGQRSQARLTRRQRIAKRRGAFQLRANIPPKALLIDDVAATGATLAAAGHALVAGGCEVVGAVVIASPNK